MATAASPKRRRSLFLLWTRRLFLGGIAFFALYFLAAFALSRIPANRGFLPPKDGVEIAVCSNGVHVDLALPLRNDHFDWMEHLKMEDFPVFDSRDRVAAFGWGERTFYLETPTWSDIDPLNVLRAMCGAGSSIMHVDLLSSLPPSDASCRRIKISPKQYKKLCSEILAAMKTDPNGKLISIPGAHYNSYDAFYEAEGHYHLFHTCNAWAGDILRASGVRVGLWTPTTDGVFACLPISKP